MLGKEIEFSVFPITGRHQADENHFQLLVTGLVITARIYFCKTKQTKNYLKPIFRQV